MEIKHYNTEIEGFFKALENKKEAGRLTYSWVGTDKIIIDHTWVNPEFRGGNVGKRLIMAAVDYARENKIKIIPLCSFVKRVFDKIEDIRDVLA